MITYPCCKINLGLYVTEKRHDGYHNLETAFYPVEWCDALEVVEHPDQNPFELRCSGPVSPGNGKNIIEKAWEYLCEAASLPPLLVYLYKNIPAGAGLGGGSADAAFFLKLVSKRFSLQLDDRRLHEMALRLGSDCPFFLETKPLLATGRGEIFRPLHLSLDRYFILVVNPGIHISTAKAFSWISPARPQNDLAGALQADPAEWRHTVKNDFEPGAMKMHPELQELKKMLYAAGAVYASMSGSGSSFFGIFEQRPRIDFGPGCRTFLREPVSKIL